MISSRDDRALLEKYIARVSLFRDIKEDRLARIIADFGVAHAAKNETVIAQEDTSTDLYLILRGRVKVTLMSDEGGEYVLTDLSVGDCFGEMSLIDGKPRCATVVAVEDATFAVLRREHLVAAVMRDPVIALDLLSTLVSKLRKATEREERFAFLDVRARVLSLFRELAAVEGQTVQDGFCRLDKRTQKEIAMRIGASREATSQVLRTLIAEKVIIEEASSFLVAPSVFLKKSL